MSDPERLQRFLRTDPSDAGCNEAMAVLRISVDLAAAGQDVAGVLPPGTPLTYRRAPGAARALGGQRRLPAGRHRLADIRDTRNRPATFPSSVPASISPAAAGRTPFPADTLRCGQPAAIGILHGPGIPTTPAITGARNPRF